MWALINKPTNYDVNWVFTTDLVQYLSWVWPPKKEKKKGHPGLKVKTN